MKTVYDSNLVINDPRRVTDEDALLPYCVLEELDDLKRDHRIENEIHEASHLVIEQDVPTKDFSDKLDQPAIQTDDRLVQISRLDGYELYTGDMLLYLKASSYDDSSVEFVDDHEAEELYEGVHETELPQNQIDKFFSETKPTVDEIVDALPGLDQFHEHGFLDAGQVIARAVNDKFHRLDWDTVVSEVGELNRRQMMAADLILDDRVKITTLTGRAGTGKTSLAINLGIKQVQHGVYENLVLSRPMVQAGDDKEELGYLPGDIEEKTIPFLQPFFDNDNRNYSFQPEIVPLSMIQGRNFRNSLWIITEFQNVRPEDVDEIVERVGPESKLIAEGDINQNNRSHNENGLTTLVNSLKEEELFGTVNLTEVERSEVAKLGEDVRNYVEN